MKIAIHGYGRMGRSVESVAKERRHEVVILERDARRTDAGVIIDFSVAGAVDHAVSLAETSGAALVIGTTGWNDRIDEIRARCERAGIGVVHASNFSPGANVTFALARRAAELLSHFGGYACGIEERHHDRKKDAPSGTALRIAGEITAGSGGRWHPSIASSRVGMEVGLHTAFFDSADDLVEISHRARSRDGFARGAVVAAEQIAGRKGFFTFDELLGL